MKSKLATVMMVLGLVPFMVTAEDAPGPMSGEPEAGRHPVLDRKEVLGPFLSDHWTLPIPLQGPPPEGWSAFEADQNPASCGACHPEQYADWQSTLHAKAYSPGFAGQLIEGSLSRPRSLRSCQTCHTPLEEQQPVTSEGEPNPAYDPALRDQGMVCATCHVRAHEHRGPPRRADLPPLAESLPHGGFVARDEFTQARFCASCHQFFGRPGPSGRPIQNTFVEWEDSPHAEAGDTCQSCHMPDRAHRWRGIHDIDTVKAATDVTLTGVMAVADRIEARLALRSEGVGHMLPTYTTPRLFLEVVQVGPEGEEISETLESFEIGRRVNFRQGRDIFDTRIAPGRSATLYYNQTRSADAVAIVGRVRVDPAYHYRGVFSRLRSRYKNEKAKALIAEAHRLSSETPYVLEELRAELVTGRGASKRTPGTRALAGRKEAQR